MLGDILVPMPTPLLTRILDPAALLDRAVEGLWPPHSIDGTPWPTLAGWIVLRQGGLRDDLHRLAAARGVPGWFDPPICLFTELSERWGPEGEAAPLMEPERHALLARLLDEQGDGLIPRARGDAWVPTVDRLIGELMSEDVEPSQFAAALDATAQDEFGTRRALALGRVYGAWRAALAAARRSDGRDARVRLARFIREQPSQFAARLGGRRDVRIVGLADLRGGWSPLLAALAECPALDRLEIITSAALDVPGATHEAPLPDRERPQTLRLIEAADTAREMERIAVEVRRLIDTGAEPARIAVIAREARPAVDAMAATLSRMGVPVTARRRTALAHTAPGRALLAILHVLREQWGRHAVAELAEHPLLSTGLDAGVVNAVGYAQAMTSADDWREGFDALLARAERRARGDDEGEDRRTALPAVERITSTREAWARLAPALESLQQARSLAQWCAWCVDTLEDGRWGIAARICESPGDAALWHLELRARDRIRALLEAWQQASETFDTRGAAMDVERFLDRLLLILAQDLITLPETDFGVLVSEALAAGWRAFDHVFVVGMSAGQFPMRPSEGILLDADEREQLRRVGIPLDAPDAWRSRERELFRVLCAAPRASLTLSWPALDAEGRETARSAFVDEFVTYDRDQRETNIERMPPQQVLIAGYPVASDDEAVTHAHAAAAREEARRDAYEGVEHILGDTVMTPWNGEITDPELKAWLAQRYGERYPWSATQLETLAKCPWHWFAARLLKLEDRREADDLIEPTVSGTLRHEALDLFFERARAERFGGAPVLLGDGDAAWVKEAIAVALRERWTHAEQTGVWLGPPATREVLFEEMLRTLESYLAFEIQFNEQYANNRTNASKVIRSGAIAGEYAFEDVSIEAHGLRFQLRGMVDRIDQGVDPRIEGAEQYLAAIDYKSSKYSTPAAGDKDAWSDGIVLQVPLYAEALQQRFPDQRVVRMEYRTLGAKPERVHALNLAPVSKGGLQDASDAESQLAGALDSAGRRVRAARSGTLPAAPVKSAGCSPYCPARDICRIPGGPRKAAKDRR